MCLGVKVGMGLEKTVSVRKAANSIFIESNSMSFKKEVDGITRGYNHRRRNLWSVFGDSGYGRDTEQNKIQFANNMSFIFIHLH